MAGKGEWTADARAKKEAERQAEIQRREDAVDDERYQDLALAGTPVLTVAELIAALEKVENKSLHVWGEGCDCDNPVISVDVRRSRVMIEVTTR